MKKSVLSFVSTFMMFLVFLSGCGGDSSSSTNSVATTTINGQATLGPLSGSNILLMDLNNTIIGSSTTKDDNTDLDNAGSFSFTVESSKLPNTLLLVAGGGKDIDPLDDGTMNNNVDNNGSIHAIVTLDDLQLQGLKINPLTEIIYQDASDTYGNGLASLSKSDLRTFLDKEAKIYLTDANATYSDILTFNPRVDKTKSKINWDKVLSLVVAGIHNGESSGVINQRVTSLKSWLKNEGVYTSDDNASIEQIQSDGNGDRVVTSVTKADDNSSIGTISQILTTSSGEIINIYASKVNSTESYLRATVTKQGHEFSVEGKTTLLQGLSFDTNTITNFVDSLITVTDSNATAIQITIDKQLTNRISDHEVVLKIDGREPTAEEMQVIADDPIILFNYKSLLSSEIAVKKIQGDVEYITLKNGTIVVKMPYYKLDEITGLAETQDQLTSAKTYVGIIGDLASLTLSVACTGTGVGAVICGANTILSLQLTASDLMTIGSGVNALRLQSRPSTITKLMGKKDANGNIILGESYRPVIYFRNFSNAGDISDYFTSIKPYNEDLTFSLSMITDYYDYSTTSYLNSIAGKVDSKSDEKYLCKLKVDENYGYVIFPNIEVSFLSEMAKNKFTDMYATIDTYANKSINAESRFKYNYHAKSNNEKIYTDFTYSIVNNQLSLDAITVTSGGSTPSHTWKNASGTTIATGKQATVSFNDLIVNDGLTSITLETQSANYTGTKTKLISLCGANEVYQNGACVQQVLYENFSSTPKISYTYGLKNGEYFQYDATNGFYKVKILEQDGKIYKFAYLEPFSIVSNQSFDLSFDFNLKDISWGMPIGIYFGKNDFENNPFMGISIRSTNNKIYFYDGQTNSIESTNAITLNTWYNVHMLYNSSTNTVDINVTNKSDDSLFFQTTRQPFAPISFEKIGMGSRTVNTDGISAEMYYDNISIQLKN